MMYKVTYKRIMENGESSLSSCFVYEPVDPDKDKTSWTREDMEAFEMYRRLENAGIKNVVIQKIENVTLLDDNEEAITLEYGEKE